MWIWQEQFIYDIFLLNDLLTYLPRVCPVPRRWANCSYLAISSALTDDRASERTFSKCRAVITVTSDPPPFSCSMRHPHIKCVYKFRRYFHQISEVESSHRVPSKTKVKRAGRLSSQSCQLTWGDNNYQTRPKLLRFNNLPLPARHYALFTCIATAPGSLKTAVFLSILLPNAIGYSHLTVDGFTHRVFFAHTITTMIGSGCSEVMWRRRNLQS